MRAYKVSKPLLISAAGVAAVGVVVLASSCSSGSDTPDEAVATIDSASVSSAINDFGGVVGICKDAASSTLQSQRKLGVAGAVRGAMQAVAQQRRSDTMTRLALGSTQPADTLGDCGGRFGFRGYNHASGVTTATLAFENYCTLDSATGDKQLVDGSIAFVDTATPTPSGPVTTQLVADTSRAVTLVVQTAAGAPVSSQTMSFSGFRMTVGVPGGTPTVANPNLMLVGDMSVKDNDTGKTYRQSNYQLRQYETPAGNTEMSFSGRGYRSDGSYFDIATTQPVVQNAVGDTVSGAITFTGANGSNAVATLVPGSAMQATLTVNGVPVTSVPVCSRGP